MEEGKGSGDHELMNSWKSMGGGPGVRRKTEAGSQPAAGPSPPGGGGGVGLKDGLGCKVCPTFGRSPPPRAPCSTAGRWGRGEASLYMK